MKHSSVKPMCNPLSDDIKFKAIEGFQDYQIRSKHIHLILLLSVLSAFTYDIVNITLMILYLGVIIMKIFVIF